MSANVAPDGPRLGRVNLLSADAELLRYVGEEEATNAARALMVPAADLAPGPFDLDEVLSWGLHSFGVIVVSGLVTQEVALMGQPTLRLLGPGEVIVGRRAPTYLVSSTHAWAASAPTRLALLDDHTLRVARRWPRLIPALIERASESQDAVVLQLAISQQPRVEARIVALFAMLAERWGKIHPSGIVLELSLTHEAVGRLVGARRPTVTLAMRSLAARGCLERRSDRTWLVRHADASSLPASSEPLSARQRPQLVGTADGRFAGSTEEALP